MRFENKFENKWVHFWPQMRRKVEIFLPLCWTKRLQKYKDTFFRCGVKAMKTFLTYYEKFVIVYITKIKNEIKRNKTIRFPYIRKVARSREYNWKDVHKRANNS